MATPLFEVRDLHATAGDIPILKGVDLTVLPGEVHALMGPNGAGKSTLANALMGSPDVTITQGSIHFKGDDITSWGPDVRGKAGVFLAFQYPQEIPGVSVINFLRQALSARKGIDLSVLELRLSIMEWMKRLGLDSSFADRYLNEGFSGGEKKRNEILQLAILEPAMAILDETDSGLDIDALRVVASGVQRGARRSARARCAGHHPLPATPGPPHDPTWCTSSSTAASWTRGGLGARPPAWRPRGSTHGSREGRCHDARPRRRRRSRTTSRSSSTPHPRPSGWCSSTRPRRRRSPSQVHRRDGATTTSTYARQRAPRRRTALAEGSHQRAWRERAPRSRRFVGAASERGDRLHQATRPSRINLVARSAGVRANLQAPGDVDPAEPSSSTTPTSCRGSSSRPRSGFEIRWILEIDDTGHGKLDLTSTSIVWSTANLAAEHLARCRTWSARITPVRRHGRHAAHAVPERW